MNFLEEMLVENDTKFQSIIDGSRECKEVLGAIQAGYAGFFTTCRREISDRREDQLTSRRIENWNENIANYAKMEGIIDERGRSLKAINTNLLIDADSVESSLRGVNREIIEMRNKKNEPPKLEHPCDSTIDETSIGCLEERMRQIEAGIGRLEEKMTKFVPTGEWKRAVEQLRETVERRDELMANNRVLRCAEQKLVEVMNISRHHIEGGLQSNVDIAAKLCDAVESHSFVEIDDLDMPHELQKDEARKCIRHFHQSFNKGDYWAAALLAVNCPLGMLMNGEIFDKFVEAQAASTYCDALLETPYSWGKWEEDLCRRLVDFASDDEELMRRVISNERMAAGVLAGDKGRLGELSKQLKCLFRSGQFEEAVELIRGNDSLRKFNGISLSDPLLDEFVGWHRTN